MSFKEAHGNTEVVNSFKHFGFKAYKIPDIRGSRFTANKPYDIVACSKKGRYIAVEGKLIKKWQGITKNVFQPHQPIELDAIVKRNGRAFLFVYIRINACKGHKRVCKLVIFDWAVHRKDIMCKGIGVTLMRSQSIGTWLDPFKDKNDKIIWPLKNLLVR